MVDIYILFCSQTSQIVEAIIPRIRMCLLYEGKVLEVAIFCKTNAKIY